MGSGYFGEPNMGNERSGGGGTSSSTTTTRKSNKKGNTAAEKSNKQPQRGLGVAQLEKIRLHSQLGSSAMPCNNNNINYLPNPIPIPPPNYNLTGTPHHHQYHLQVEEDMRLVQTTAGYSSSYSFPGHHQSINVMGLSDLERANLRYGDAVQSAAVCSSTRWSSGSSSNSGGGAIINGGGLMDTQQFTQPSMTRQLLDLQLLDHHHQNDTIIEKRRRKDGRDEDDDESSGHQDLDLELRLSLKY